MQKNTEDLRAGAGEQGNASLSHRPSSPPVGLQGQRVLRGQELQQPYSDPVSRKMLIPGGQWQQHAGRSLSACVLL